MAVQLASIEIFFLFLSVSIGGSTGCNVNVCFAIDETGSISAREFLDEKAFALDVADALAGQGTQFAAVQYGSSSVRARVICPLTSNLFNGHSAIKGASQLRTRTPAISTGILGCSRELSKRVGAVNKIVLLGDGGNAGPAPVAAADSFRDTGGEVCAVAVGASDKELLVKVTRNPELVFTTDNFSGTGTLAEFVRGLEC